MRQLLFAIKRCFHSVSLLLMMLLLVAILPLAAQLGKVPEQLPAGVLDLDQTPLSQRITNELLGNNFVLYTEEAELLEAVECAEVDCGVVLPEGLATKIADGTVEKQVKVIRSPQSMTAELYLGHVSAGLFSELAPYITANALQQYEIPEEEVLAVYHAMLAEGYAFSFEVLAEDGLPVPENARARSLMIGVTAVLLYIAISTTTVDLIHREARSLLPGIGLKKSICHIFLPGIVVRLALLCLAAAAGLLLSERVTTGFSETELILPACIYCLLIGGVSVVAAGLCRDTRVLYLLLFVVMIAAVVICPIYIDISVVGPVFVRIRNFVPIYWLWKICLIF